MIKEKHRQREKIPNQKKIFGYPLRKNRNLQLTMTMPDSCESDRMKENKQNVKMGNRKCIWDAIPYYENRKPFVTMSTI